MHQEALRKTIEVNLNQLTIFRAALAKEEDYKAIKQEMKEKMNAVQIGASENMRQSWAELKKRGA